MKPQKYNKYDYQNYKTVNKVSDFIARQKYGSLDMSEKYICQHISYDL